MHGDLRHEKDRLVACWGEECVFQSGRHDGLVVLPRARHGRHLDKIEDRFSQRDVVVAERGDEMYQRSRGRVEKANTRCKETQAGVA